MAIIAVIYFVGFPTFFTDMPFLNRQEIAYLFVAACVMAATDQQLPREATHARIGVFSIGVVFSHYSASYVFLGTLVLGWLFCKLFAALRFIRANGRGAAWPRARKMVLTPSVSLLNVVILVAGIGLWNGLATHTVGGFGTTLVQAVESLRGGTDTGKSEDVSYSLFGGGAESDSQVMDQYEKSTMNQPDATRKAEGFYTSAELAKYKYPLVSVPLENLPVTSLGNAADSAGVNVGTLNSALRSGSSKLLQLFVLLGLLSAFVRARKRGSVWITELIALALGAFVIVALQVVLPVISADYGVLRAPGRLPPATPTRVSSSTSRYRTRRTPLRSGCQSRIRPLTRPISRPHTRPSRRPTRRRW